MNDFPSSADEFYRLRDDRTNRCCASREYQKVACTVFLPREGASAPTAQVMLLVAANLLSRWCRKVTIVLPPAEVHPALRMGGGDLGRMVLEQMRDADPFGDFEITDSRDSASDVALCLGDTPYDSQYRPAVFINAAGWLAGLSMHEPVRLSAALDGNCLGAIASACLGVAQVFKIAVKMTSASYLREGIFDLFRFVWSQDLQQAPWPAYLNVGRVLMVGAGSVGSSAAYCLRFSGLAGAISVVDRDIAKIGNFNRSPLFGRRTLRLPKVNVIADYLTGSGLSATGIPFWWDDFLRERGRSSFDFDVWVPVANDFGVRLAMQHNVPPLMIHASTTANWGVNHGRHIPGRDDCLADRFPAEVSSDNLACATGRVEASETVIDAALPFTSLFAGLLIAADLVRAQLPGYPQVPNFALFDWGGPLDTIQAWDRKSRTGCICQEQGNAFHERLNGGTKYWKLLRFA